MFRVFVFGRDYGVGDQPVQVGALSRSPGPFRDAPSARGVRVGIPLPLAFRVLHVAAPVGHIDDLGPRAGLGRRDLSELSLVVVVHVDDRSLDAVLLGTALPVEMAVPQEEVIGLQGRQIVAPCVAVALGIQDAPVGLVDETVLVRVGNVVRKSVGGFALAFGEIPHQPVVGRTRAGFLHSSQEGQFLGKKVRQLVLEGEDGGGQMAVFHAVASEPDGGIQGVRVGLVAQQHVEVRYLGCGLQQRGPHPGTGRGIGPVYAEGLCPFQNGLIQLDKPHAFDDFLGWIQGHGPFVSLPGLADHARVGGRRVRISEIPDPGIVGVDGIGHPLDPSHEKLRPGSRVSGPVGKIDSIIVFIQRVDMPIPAIEQVVHQRGLAGPGDGNLHSPGHGVPEFLPLIGSEIRRSLLGPVVLSVIPLENQVVRIPSKVAGVAQRRLFVEHVVGEQYLNGPPVFVVYDLDDGHCHGAAHVFVVVLDQRDISFREVFSWVEQGGVGHQGKAGTEQVFHIGGLAVFSIFVANWLYADGILCLLICTGQAVGIPAFLVQLVGGLFPIFCAAFHTLKRPEFVLRQNVRLKAIDCRGRCVKIRIPECFAVEKTFYSEF